VWGSTLVVDEKRNSLYVTTGNNYTIPSEVQTCIDLARVRTYANAGASAAAEEFCIPVNDYIDAVMALNPATGELICSRRFPGGTLGSIEWGSAADGARIYVAIGNSSHRTYNFTAPGGGTHNAGSWAALDAVTGKVLWQVKVPGQDPVMPQFGAMATGAVTVA